MENTYVLYDETKECIIVDPGCQEDYEKKALKDYIEQNELKPVRLVNTHCHIDHVAGNNFVHQTWNLPLECNHLDIPQLERAAVYGEAFGFVIEPSPMPEGDSLEEGMKLTFGNTSMDIIFAPGHAPGHVCFYNEENKTLLAGDCLFAQGIGRTDLPGGDYQTLIDSIKTKLLVLPEDTTVYSGHGPETNIGAETWSNPFLT